MLSQKKSYKITCIASFFFFLILVLPKEPDGNLKSEDDDFDFAHNTDEMCSTCLGAENHTLCKCGLQEHSTCNKAAICIICISANLLLLFSLKRSLVLIVIFIKFRIDNAVSHGVMWVLIYFKQSHTHKIDN